MPQTESTAANNKRIAKNTIALYIRMIILMFVALYTSRVVLQTLGVEDFGVYNVVGGLVVMFSFLKNAMTTSVQRFLNFELGKNDLQAATNIFSASLVIHIIIALLIIVLGETIGVWFLNTYLDIPQDRIHAANWCLQFTIFATAINIICSPYNAAIISYERMSFYAYTSIAEAILKLGTIFMIIYIEFDKLVLYSAFMFVVPIIMTIIYVIYCRVNFSICRFKINNSKELYQNLIGFSGWSLFGSIADVFSIHGISIIFNIFGGVVFNAAMGIANQIVNTVYSFVSNFQIAFRPQIVKTYANGAINDFQNLVFRASRFSFYLLLIMTVPYLIGADLILALWLETPPEFAADFSRLLLLYLLIDAMSAPLWMSAQAIGDIRNYQLIISFNILLIIPTAIVLLSLGYSPIAVLVAKVFINFTCHVTRLLYLRKKISFPTKQYIIDVMKPIATVSAAIFVISYPLNKYFDGSSIITLIKMIIAFGVSVIAIYLFGITQQEKDYLLRFIRIKHQ